MSKMDNQRAMREAKYARDQAAAAKRRTTTPGQAAAPVAPPVSATPAPKKGGTRAAAAAESGELCGHASMNGRTCTRPAGHSEKSHRYG